MTRRLTSFPFVTLVVLVFVSVLVAGVAASEHTAREGGAAVAPETEGSPQHAYLASQWMSNLATFDMMERSPLAFNEPSAVVDAELEQNLAKFELQERAPGVYTETSDDADAESTLTHPWGGDSIYVDY